MPGESSTLRAPINRGASLENLGLWARHSRATGMWFGRFDLWVAGIYSGDTGGRVTMAVRVALFLGLFVVQAELCGYTRHPQERFSQACIQLHQQHWRVLCVLVGSSDEVKGSAVLGRAHIKFSSVVRGRSMDRVPWESYAALCLVSLLTMCLCGRSTTVFLLCLASS